MLPLTPEILCAGLLLVTFALFALGRWRYDVVAIVALLLGVALGLIPTHEAFVGFGHPAVITVALVLIISKALANAGVGEQLGRLLQATLAPAWLHRASCNVLTAVLSAFMNNVGALALMMPVVSRQAHRCGIPPGRLLMPISFSALLGGMTTLIGTPPNIVISNFREDSVGVPFGLFDFMPVGLTIALCGLLYLSLLGWRFLPRQQALGLSPQERSISHYLTEVRVPPSSPLVSQVVRVVSQMSDGEISVLAVVRGKRQITNPSPNRRLRADDLLILKGNPESLSTLIAAAKCELLVDAEIDPNLVSSEQQRTVEVVIIPGSYLEGRTPHELRLQDYYGLTLLAVSSGHRGPVARMRQIRLRSGDVLMVQGSSAEMNSGLLQRLGCAPLVDRAISFQAPMGSGRKTLFFFALGLVATGLGILPIEIALCAVVLALVLTRALTLSELYSSIAWPVIVLLGAMIPIGRAVQTSGLADQIAHLILSCAATLPLWALLALLMMLTMLLTDVINNTATAVISAPIAVAIGQHLALSPDPFLIGVAVSCSCAFLTPIGHQNNALIMTPGGYRFFDFLRVGFFLDLLVLLVGVPTILLFWPP